MPSADQVSLTAHLQKKHYILDAMLENSSAVVGVKDLEGRYLMVNKEYERLFGLSESDMLGKTDLELFSAEIAEAFIAADRRVATQGQSQHVEETAQNINGETLQFLSVKFPVRDEQGEIFAVGVIATDITERKAVELRFQQTQQELEAANAELRNSMEKMEMMAVVDQLTGAWNRYKFEEVAAIEIGRFHRYNTPLSMLMFDIDGFKQVNDDMGHETGDHVLKAVVDLYQRSIREVDFLFRWGGDEFIMLMPSTGQAMATSVADKLRQTLSDSDLAKEYNISASFSVAVLKEEEAIQQWLIRADQGLYKAKDMGKNCVYYCE